MKVLGRRTYAGMGPKSYPAALDAPRAGLLR